MVLYPDDFVLRGHGTVSQQGGRSWYLVGRGSGAASHPPVPRTAGNDLAQITSDAEFEKPWIRGASSLLHNRSTRCSLLYIPVIDIHHTLCTLFCHRLYRKIEKLNDILLVVFH